MFVKISMRTLATASVIVVVTILSFGQSADTKRKMSPETARTLLAAKTVQIVGGKSAVVQTDKNTLLVYPIKKAEDALKKALAKWGRFQIVDDAGKADLVLIISEDRSWDSRRMERISEHLAIFAGGSVPNENATPLWEVEEVGPAFGFNRRPTGKLVEDLRNALAEFEKSPPPSVTPSS